VFFNIERLDVLAENIINIDSFVYTLGAIGATVIICIPALQNFPAYTLNIVNLLLYLFGKVFVFHHKPLIGGLYTYLSITEATLLSVLLWVAYKLARALSDFEKAVESIAMEDVSHHIRTPDEAMHEVQIHMHLSRRQQSPLSVVVLEPETTALPVLLAQALQEAQQALLTRCVLTTLTRAVSTTLRRTDVLFEQRQQGRLVLLCPLTNATGAKTLVHRLQSLIAAQHQITVRCGYAAFPEEALTFEELLRKAEEHLTYQPQQHAARLYSPPRAPAMPPPMVTKT
jgi:hypothetical protein